MLYWATGFNTAFAVVLIILCLIFILAGFFCTGEPAWAVWAGYRRLLSTTGRAPSDYLRMFGAGPVLVNMGVNGLLGMLYIFLNWSYAGRYFYDHRFFRYGKACV